MNKGDKVVVIKSPYRSVKNGTISTIEDTYGHRFGTKYEVFKLTGIPDRYFKEYEIALIVENVNEDIYTTD